MPKIFLSYRRDDSIDIAGRIYDRLSGHFGDESVFMDIDSIPFGVDFRTYLSSWVSKCDVLLAIIGDGWLDSIDDQGNRRLGSPIDFVTIEITSAIRREIPVVPILVGNSIMPKPDQLPTDMIDFAFRNATEVRSGRDFHSHVNRLVQGIEHVYRETTSNLVTSREDAGVRNHETNSTKPGSLVVSFPAVASPTNLAFEDSVVDGAPAGWFNSSGFVSGVSTDYDFKVINYGDGGSGKYLRVNRMNANNKEFGSLMQRCPSFDFEGKRIRVEATIKSENLDDWAGLWMRVDGDASHLFFDNMSDRPIKGSTDWVNYLVQTDLLQGSEWLNYGVLLSGNGVLYIDKFVISISDIQGNWVAI